MRVSVDEDRCCGAGNCVLSAPTVFSQEADTGVVVLLAETPAEGVAPAVREARLLCPVGAIRIIES
jgi:ferredoxin